MTQRGSDTFGYDQANRLTAATTSTGSGTYTYDGDGKRASKTVGGVTTKYVYDVAGGLPVLLDDGARKYVWGAGGLAYSVDKSSGAVQVYHSDGLGSMRALTDSTGTVTQTYQTDEFGVPLASGTQGTAGQPFSFTGEQRDSEDGLVYLRARIYDASTGRFLQRDSLPGAVLSSQSLNRFDYVGDNPATRVDPSGHCWGPAIGVLPGCIGAVVGGIGGAASYFVSIAENGDGFDVVKFAGYTGGGAAIGFAAGQAAIIEVGGAAVTTAYGAAVGLGAGMSGEFWNEWIDGAGRGGHEFNPGAIAGGSVLGLVTGGVGGYAGKVFVGLGITDAVNKAAGGLAGGLVGAEGTFVGSLLGAAVPAAKQEGAGSSGEPPVKPDGEGGAHPHGKG